MFFFSVQLHAGKRQGMVEGEDLGDGGDLGKYCLELATFWGDVRDIVDRIGLARAAGTQREAVTPPSLQKTACCSGKALHTISPSLSLSKFISQKALTFTRGNTHTHKHIHTHMHSKAGT